MCSVGSEASLQESVERVNGALLGLVKKHRRELEEILRTVGTPGEGGLNLAGVDLAGFHYMLMKVPTATLEPLTPRQREIALAVLEGLSNQELSRRFGITTSTVAAHLRTIYKKLRVDSRAALLLRLFASQDSSATRS